jgi:hypothetical protein
MQSVIAVWYITAGYESAEAEVETATSSATGWVLLSLLGKAPPPVTRTLRGQQQGFFVEEMRALR